MPSSVATFTLGNHMSVVIILAMKAECSHSIAFRDRDPRNKDVHWLYLISYMDEQKNV